MNRHSGISPGDRLGLTLFLAIILHAVVILGISFDIEKPKKPPAARTLEVMVVHNPSPSKQPKEADFLAQVSQQGSGEAAEKKRPATLVSPPAPQRAPLPAPKVKPAPPPATTKKQPPKKILTQKRPAAKKVRVKVRKKPAPKVEKKRITAAQLLASTNREIDRLTAELDRKQQAYSKQPRRHKRLTANTREYKYAAYLEAWRKKVERIGNLNYPDEAKRRRLYGNLILHVAIRPDGTVQAINVKKSSGHKLLDDAAVRIVRLAAPFAPFPPNIRKETDIIDIIRTWQFRSNNQLYSK